MAANNSVEEFADELRKWWSFSDEQRHTHSWHSREDFIAKKLPSLLSSYTDMLLKAEREECAKVADKHAAKCGTWTLPTGQKVPSGEAHKCMAIAVAIRAREA